MDPIADKRANYKNRMTATNYKLGLTWIAITHAGWLVTLTFDLLIPKYIGHQESSWNILHVKFTDPSCIGSWDIMRINRQTNGSKDLTPATAVGLGN